MLDPHAQAWRLILAADARSKAAPERAGCYSLAGDCLTETTPQDGAAQLLFEQGWHALASEDCADRKLLDLYLPLVGTRNAAAPVLAQLGQSLDGFIALADGRSHYVTGPASILHLHRLRALSDCVIVGAGTVAADDPQLTTRLVAGRNPLRVVLDPKLRLPLDRKVFQDGQAPTLRVRAQGTALPSSPLNEGVADMEIACRNGQLDLAELVNRLRAQGHRTILVEGGGVTISAFLRAGLLQRLHVVSAPMFIGRGRPGLPLPEHFAGHAPAAMRAYALDQDLLFDCQLATQEVLA